MRSCLMNIINNLNKNGDLSENKAKTGIFGLLIVKTGANCCVKVANAQISKYIS